jgi:hypothetical protein
MNSLGALKIIGPALVARGLLFLGSGASASLYG